MKEQFHFFLKLGKRYPKFLSFLCKNLTYLVLSRECSTHWESVWKILLSPKYRIDFFIGDAQQVFEIEKTDMTTPL